MLEFIEDSLEAFFYAYALVVAGGAIYFSYEKLMNRFKKQ